MDPSKREAATRELARCLGEHLEERDRDYLEKGGLVCVKLLLVDAGGDRRLVVLGPPMWKLETRNAEGELLFLEQLQLVGVELARQQAVERPLEDVVGDIAGE